MIEKLTPMEYKILDTWAECGTGKETAFRLQLTKQTVKNHMFNARRKVGAVSTGQMLYWLGAGEIDDYLPMEADKDMVLG